MASKQQPKKQQDTQEMSPEDQELKEKIDLIVSRILSNDPAIQQAALVQLKNELRGVTVTMSSIPKHLKFLRPHYQSLASCYDTVADAQPNKILFADIMSLLAMTIAPESPKETEKENTSEESEDKQSTESESTEQGSTEKTKEEKEAENAKKEEREMKERERRGLAYRLAAGGGAACWGHEYVRNLSAVLAEEYVAVDDALQRLDVNSLERDTMDKETDSKVLNEEKKEKLLKLIKEIVPFQISHNAETDACDLLLETHLLDLLQPNLDLTSRDSVSVSKYRRVCVYLSACAPHFPHPEDNEIYRIVFNIYLSAGDCCSAMRYALVLNDKALVEMCFAKAENSLVRKQLAFMQGRHRPTDLSDLTINTTEDERYELSLIASNSKLSKLFNGIISSLDLGAAKSASELFFGQKNAEVHSTKEILALALGAAFINAGYGKSGTDEITPHVRSGDRRTSMAAVAGLGLASLWDLDNINDLTAYTKSESEGIRAGAYLGIGLVGCNVRSEVDPVFALLSEALENEKSNITRIGAAFGLGLAYVGTARDDVCKALFPLMTESDPELVCIAALSIGLIQIGTCHGDFTETLISLMMEGSKIITESTYARFICLAIGLLYLGQGDACEVALALTDTFPGELSRYARITIESCAFAMSGDVLKIQQLLAICGEHPKKKAEKDDQAKKTENGENQEEMDIEETSAAQPAETAAKESKEAKNSTSKSEEKKDKEVRKPVDPQSVATLGLGLIVTDDVGVHMTTRMTEHLLRYGEPAVRRSVPLTLGLLYLSNPAVKIIDYLTKLTHDHDREVSISAIIALGLCCAGTCNSRAGSVLRDLEDLCTDKPEAMFAIRVAQSLMQLGKGAMTISPVYSDHMLFSPVAMAGVLVLLHACLDLDKFILGDCPYLLYSVAIAMFPRVMQTVAVDDETIEHAKAIAKKEKEERERVFKTRKTMPQMDVEEDKIKPFIDELTLQPLPVTVRVGQRVDTAGLAGRPSGITGIQTHTTPVLLYHNDRAEMASDEYVPISTTLEGFVVVRKATADDIL